jgi:AcrR family transcriptional regulator
MAAIQQLPSLADLPANAPVRLRIITAAVETLHGFGFSALTQQAVAGRAGVRQSHVTYYFPTRNDLLRATAQFGCEKMLEPITGAAEQGLLTAEEFRTFLLPDEMDRAWFRLMTGLLIACEEDQSIRSWLSEFDARIRARIQLGFAAVIGDVPDEAVQMLHACFIGAMHLDAESCTEASLARARRVVGRAIDLIAAEAVPRATSKLVPAKARLALAHQPTQPKLGPRKKRNG